MRKSRVPGRGRYLIRLDTMWQLILSARVTVCLPRSALSLHSIALVSVKLGRSVLDDC